MPGTSISGSSPALRVGFLFNHESLHHIAHSAPFITELKRVSSALDITILASSDEQLGHVRRYLEPSIAEDLSFVLLRASAATEWLDRYLRHVAPVRSLSVLRANLDQLRSFDVLIVPETLSLTLRTHFGLEDVRFIYTHHGAGDRSAGYTPEIEQIDFVLVSGRKIRDRLLSMGRLREGRFAVVGYPKFDGVSTEREMERRFFDNDNPVVLYNPHFEPRLSSWYSMGDAVLDYFARTPQYNLIFAPHVMLFQRRLHTTPENLGFRLRRRLAERHRNHSNIRIDLGSEACVDMTYTMNADIYIGDVSSQVYEFLLKPRPCIFLNSHGAQWKRDPSYQHWTTGPVLDRAEDIHAALSRARSDHEKYRPIQEELFAETFESSDVSSGRRGAEAIASFLSGITPIETLSPRSP